VAAQARPPKGIDETLVRAVAHPLRVRALAVLNERVASPKELASELGAPVSNVSYHVRELNAAGLIELVDEKTRRGAVEHFYRTIAGPAPTRAEFVQLNPEQRRGVSTRVIQLLLADLTRALVAGSFDARGDRHLSRTPLLVDERGWREVVEISDKALAAIFDVQAASGERLAAGRKKGRPVIAALTCFELPPGDNPPTAPGAP